MTQETLSNCPVQLRPQAAQSIVLYDGDCGMCNRSVRFIFERDNEGRFYFASLQSETAQQLLAEANLSFPSDGSGDTMVLLEEGQSFTRSTAALRIARRLTRPWNWLAIGLLIPAVLRDSIYRIIAANRYRFFGKHDVCNIPSPELRARMRS